MRILSCFVLLTAASFFACGGATADDKASSTGQDAGASAAPSASNDAGAAKLGDGGRASTPTQTPSTPPTPSGSPADAGPQGICPNGEPTPGTTCGPEIGPVCVYATNDCVCQTSAPGNPGRWACSPRLPDGGVGCPLKDPSPGQSCLGYLGSHCELGLGTCVCPDDVVGPAWSCSDG